MKELTTKQQRVLDTLRDAGGDYLAPTDIGCACGLDYHRASSWAAGALKALEQRGLAVRGEGETVGMWAATGQALAE